MLRPRHPFFIGVSIFLKSFSYNYLKSNIFLNFFLDESHNHNDVGNFILFQNGHPVLIDIGVGTYTAQTFNAHRYELFYMQSEYHNCPTINNVAQHAGSQYSSHNVSFVEHANNGGIHFSADIAKAYPTEAHVKQWIRSFDFDRNTNQSK